MRQVETAARLSSRASFDIPCVVRQIRAAGSRFTLIEVILGLGVLAFGVISLLALFPVSLQASRDSLAETYAAESAEQFLHFFSGRITSPDNDFMNWADVGMALPTSKPGVGEPDSGWDPWFSADATVISGVSGSSGLHRIERGTVGAEGADFSAICRVWRERVRITRFTGGSWDTVQLPWTDAMSLHLEISWPAVVPYVRRQKALYHVDIYRNDDGV